MHRSFGNTTEEMHTVELMGNSNANEITTLRVAASKTFGGFASCELKNTSKVFSETVLYTQAATQHFEI